MDVEDLKKLGHDLIGPDHGVIDFESPLNYDQAKLRLCVLAEFRPLFRSLARLVAAFDCDLIFVSGKPSELRELRELLECELPILPRRILFAKDYPSGGWYPLGDGSGRIHDAKSVTVVGAALFRAMQNGTIGGWRIDCSMAESLLAENAWGDCTEPRQFDDNVFLRPGVSEATVTMLLGTPIGRKRFGSRELLPDQVYKFRRKPGKPDLQPPPLVSVKLQRERQDGSAESLKLVEANSIDGPAVSLDDIELQTCSLQGNGFWMDYPEFSVRWDEGA